MAYNPHQGKIETILNSSEQEFFGLICQNAFRRAQAEVKDAAMERLDKFIIDKIRTFQGVPCPKSLIAENGGPVPISKALIRMRFENNPGLEVECIRRGVAIVESSDKKTFLESLHIWVATYGSVREAIRERFRNYKSDLNLHESAKDGDMSVHEKADAGAMPEPAFIEKSSESARTVHQKDDHKITPFRRIKAKMEAKTKKMRTG